MTEKQKKEEVEISINLDKWMLLSAGLFILLIASLLTSGFSNITSFFVKEPTGYTNNTVIPNPKAVMTMLKDSQCAGCYDVGINKLIVQRFGVDVEEKTVEAKSEEGKALIIRYNITKIPTFLLSENATLSDQLMQVWTQVGTIENDGVMVFRSPDALDVDYELVKQDGTFEFKRSGVFQTNDTSTKLMFFVVSQCPWCKKLESEILPNFTADFGKELLKPIYLVYNNNDGTFSSMHGAEEEILNEKQVCALLQDKWYDFVQCNKTESECITGIGINETMYNKCVELNGYETTLKEHAKLSNEFGVSGTPTIFVQYNGEIVKYKGDWTNYTTLKQDFCSITNNTLNSCK